MPAGLLLIAAAAACPEVTFDFVGQPDCVRLAFVTDRIRVTNACTHPLLVDQTLLLRPDSVPIIPPQTTAEIRDLSFFTVGLNGVLFEVVAGIVPPPADCRSADAGQVDTGIAKE